MVTRTIRMNNNRIFILSGEEQELHQAFIERGVVTVNNCFEIILQQGPQGELSINFSEFSLLAEDMLAPIELSLADCLAMYEPNTALQEKYNNIVSEREQAIKAAKSGIVLAGSSEMRKAEQFHKELNNMRGRPMGNRGSH